MTQPTHFIEVKSCGECPFCNYDNESGSNMCNLSHFIGGEVITKVWDTLPYPESCPDQGYFYWDDKNECPNCGNELDGGTCYYCDDEDEEECPNCGEPLDDGECLNCDDEDDDA